MNRFLLLFALLGLTACSTTSNDITQNLQPLPPKATSWQCASGNRIIIRESHGGTLELLYRGNVITVHDQSSQTETVLQGNGLTWQAKGLEAQLSGTWTDDNITYAEECTQVLKPSE